MRTYFVGKSLVSAITQTPASGPFAPVTTPPISSALTCCANAAVGAAINKAVPIRLAANMVKYDLFAELMPRSFLPRFSLLGLADLPPKRQFSGKPRAGQSRERYPDEI